MADYMVGSGGGKDRYTVGWNKSANSPYKVGGKTASIGQASNKSLGSGDQDAVVGSKSAFEHKGDTPATYKDIGDQSPNMNVGGSVSDGATTGNTPISVSGQLQLTYTERGDWSTEKDAMARRKATMEAGKRYYSKNSDYGTPTADIITVNK